MAAGLSVKIADSVSEADVVLTTKAHFRRRAGVLVAAEEQHVPVYVLRRNTPGQIVGFLEQMANDSAPNPGDTANHGTIEAQESVERILAGETSAIELPSAIRFRSAHPAPHRRAGPTPLSQRWP